MRESSFAFMSDQNVFNPVEQCDLTTLTLRVSSIQSKLKINV